MDIKCQKEERGAIGVKRPEKPPPTYIPNNMRERIKGKRTIAGVVYSQE